MAVITVYPATLRWATKVSQADPQAVASKKGLTEFPNWLNATEPLRLSFGKLSALGKALQMPFGSLVRSSVPEETEDELVQYRTINNQEVQPSRNLTDTISAMRNRQDWAHDELSALGLSENTLVGCVETTTSAREFGLTIRKQLQLEDNWALHKSAADRFRYVRQHASERGIMVMVDSRVGTSRRNLDVQEFRAFVLLDKTAPLIFINRNDSYTAMLFSLLHEIGHVLLGSNEIFNDADHATSNSKTEQLINRAVTYAVVDDDFSEIWKRNYKSHTNVWEAANECARQYGLSALALTIHAKQLGIASEGDVKTVEEESTKRIDVERESTKKGGNQNLTNAFHLDDGFVRLVKGSIEHGSLGYSDGFSLLGVKSIQAYDGLLRAKGMEV